MFNYTITVNNIHEVTQVESALEALGATGINQEGWTTEYGGNGVTFWANSTHPRRNINMILSPLRTAKVLTCKKA